MFALGDVAGDANGEPPAVDAQWREGNLDGQCGSVLVQGRELLEPADQRPLPGEGEIRHAAPRRAAQAGRYEKLVNGPADRFVFSIAEDGLGNTGRATVDLAVNIIPVRSHVIGDGESI